ncbi:hypothetical protein M436DRAFT_67750 [Aureobasidium namibiae CBS 147.97]|uniref:Uncharacterized protein n=1 Tax=Aureobasidium namibiae CBS 147.97 TaxID=1043004 RepID=A0A074X2F8_9PEZI
MSTPAQLAQLRAHLRPLMYTLSFASLVTVMGIIHFLFLRLDRSRFLLLGMFSCLGMLYAAGFFYLLWRDLRLRPFHANRGRVRPRRPRPLGPDMLLDAIDKRSVHLFAVRHWDGSADAGAGAGINTDRSPTTARLDQAKAHTRALSNSFKTVTSNAMSVGAKGYGYSALPNNSPPTMQSLTVEDDDTPIEIKELIPRSAHDLETNSSFTGKGSVETAAAGCEEEESFAHNKYTVQHVIFHDQLLAQVTNQSRRFKLTTNLFAHLASNGVPRRSNMTFRFLLPNDLARAKDCATQMPCTSIRNHKTLTKHPVAILR